MRHRKKGSKLGRPTAHRYSMLRSMAGSLVEHGRIETTVTRARALRSFIEPLITLGKDGDLSSRRLAMRKLPNKQVVHKIFDEVAPRFKERPGGYTRIIKTNIRKGDQSQMAIIEFVD
ncbi:50S ribosomal protein L17 [Limisalsivibrio acetivorans]|uniref:50S ribosomal protein L17 n=1 Tax=Limisalsivibrio acetivorans TaxID=1304888 RepID=UPI0003B46C9A|nr:50S ribosomal protein L17 [Limisalsivibrio acetivorans]